MIIISHRGNLNGPVSEKENSPTYIMDAISAGFDVEVDVWWWNDGLWLGHDEPQWELPETFLDKIRGHAWLHCKNLDMVQRLMRTDYHWFWHEEDKATITSKGFVWCYPRNEIDGAIMVDHGQTTDTKIIGVCTDNPNEWRNK